MYCTFALAGKLLTVLMVAIALAAVSLAHNQSRAPLSPELAAYVQAGGSLSAICGLKDEQDGSAQVDCDACRIADGFALTGDHHRGTSTACSFTHKLQFVAKLRHHSKPLDPARLTRAPPQA